MNNELFISKIKTSDKLVRMHSRKRLVSANKVSISPLLRLLPTAFFFSDVLFRLPPISSILVLFETTKLPLISVKGTTVKPINSCKTFKRQLQSANKKLILTL